jgi:hypothetical protein
MQSLQQALKSTSGKVAVAKSAPVKVSDNSAKSGVKAKPSGHDGKEYTGAWLNPDFGTSLRLVQIRRRRDASGKKVYLDDLVAEALNDLFLKYDVPTVQHE